MLELPGYRLVTRELAPTSGAIERPAVTHCDSVPCALGHRSLHLFDPAANPSPDECDFFKNLGRTVRAVLPITSQMLDTAAVVSTCRPTAAMTAGSTAA